MYTVYCSECNSYTTKLYIIFTSDSSSPFVRRIYKSKTKKHYLTVIVMQLFSFAIEEINI